MPSEMSCVERVSLTSAGCGVPYGLGWRTQPSEGSWGGKIGSPVSGRGGTSYKGSRSSDTIVPRPRRSYSIWQKQD